MTVGAVDEGASRRRGLGRGLDALLSGGGRDSDPGLVELDPHSIEPNPEQPRRHFDGGDLELLAASIQLHGLLQPVIVERRGSGYQLVAGERRLRAARLAGISTIPAVVRPATESGRQSLELALTENLLREDLNPLDEAAAFQRLADTFGLSHEAIALRVGRSRASVSNTVRLLALTPPVQALVEAGELSAGHARALLALTNAVEQETLARRITAEGLSVRAVEGIIASRSQPAPNGSARPAAGVLRPDDVALERGLEQALGTPVHLQRRRRGGGRLVVEFFSDEDLDALYRRLGGPLL